MFVRDNGAQTRTGWSLRVLTLVVNEKVVDSVKLLMKTVFLIAFFKEDYDLKCLRYAIRFKLNQANTLISNSD